MVVNSIVASQLSTQVWHKGMRWIYKSLRNIDNPYSVSVIWRIVLHCVSERTLIYFLGVSTFVLLAELVKRIESLAFYLIHSGLGNLRCVLWLNQDVRWI